MIIIDNTNIIQNKKKTRNNMEKSDLMKLKISLPSGCKTIIAEKSGKSRRLVDYVLSGISENTEILRMAVEMAEEHKKEMAELSRKIKEL